MRTPLTTQTAESSASVIESRKEPEDIQASDDNDEEAPDPDGGGNVPDDDGGTDGLTDGDGQLTPQQAIQMLNDLLATCSAARGM